MSTIRPTAPRRATAPSPSAARPLVVNRTPAPAAPQVKAAADDKENPLVAAFKKVQWALRWVVYGPASEEWKTREVLEDPDTRWASRAELQRATAAVAANQPAELSAIAKLGDRAAGYQALSSLCAKDPMAREALQKMLLDGRLTATKDRRNQGDTLDHLIRANQQPLVAGLDRADLLTNLIEELENPTKIAQEYRGTCVATTATILMTRQNPAEYARLVTDLARPEGKVVLGNGKTLVRNATWTNDDDGNRTPSVRLLQPALMDLGNGFLRYDNDRDVHTLTEQSAWDKIKAGFDKLRRMVRLPGGLTAGGSNTILEALLGKPYDSDGFVFRLNRGYTWGKVEKALQAGHSVPVGLMWEGGGHKILLDKVEGGHAYYTNPWGQKERMKVEEFKANLMDANLPKF